MCYISESLERGWEFRTVQYLSARRREQATVDAQHDNRSLH